MGSVRRLADKKYRIVYDAPPRTGRRRRKTETLVGVTKAEAESILADRIRAAKGGDYVEDVEMTLNNLFDRFMAAKARKCAATTVQRYDSLLRTYLRPSFGTIRLGKLKTTDLVSAYASWSRSHVSARTLLHAHDLLGNVADSIDTDDLPKAKKPESVVLDESELRRLLEEAKRPTARSTSQGYLSSYGAFHPAVAFAAYTGARRGEVLAIRWSEINLDAGTVTISRSLTETKAG